MAPGENPEIRDEIVQQEVIPEGGPDEQTSAEDLTEGLRAEMDQSLKGAEDLLQEITSEENKGEYTEGFRESTGELYDDLQDAKGRFEKDLESLDAEEEANVDAFSKRLEDKLGYKSEIAEVEERQEPNQERKDKLDQQMGLVLEIDEDVNFNSISMKVLSTVPDESMGDVLRILQENSGAIEEKIGEDLDEFKERLGKLNQLDDPEKFDEEFGALSEEIADYTLDAFLEGEYPGKKQVNEALVDGLMADQESGEVEDFNKDEIVNAENLEQIENGDQLVYLSRLEADVSVRNKLAEIFAEKSITNDQKYEIAYNLASSNDLDETSYLMVVNFGINNENKEQTKFLFLKLLENEDQGEYVVEAMSYFEDLKVFEAVVNHPKCTDAVRIDMAAEATTDELRNILLDYDELPSAAFEKMVDGASDEILERIVNHRYSNFDLMYQIYQETENEELKQSTLTLIIEEAESEHYDSIILPLMQEALDTGNKDMMNLIIMHWRTFPEAEMDKILQMVDSSEVMMELVEYARFEEKHLDMLIARTVNMPDVLSKIVEYNVLSLDQMVMIMSMPNMSPEIYKEVTEDFLLEYEVYGEGANEKLNQVYLRALDYSIAGGDSELQHIFILDAENNCQENLDEAELKIMSTVLEKLFFEGVNSADKKNALLLIKRAGQYLFDKADTITKQGRQLSLESYEILKRQTKDIEKLKVEVAKLQDKIDAENDKEKNVKNREKIKTLRKQKAELIKNSKDLNSKLDLERQDLDDRALDKYDQADTVRELAKEVFLTEKLRIYFRIVPKNEMEDFYIENFDAISVLPFSEDEVEAFEKRQEDGEYEDNGIDVEQKWIDMIKRFKESENPVELYLNVLQKRELSPAVLNLIIEENINNREVLIAVINHQKASTEILNNIFKTCEQPEIKRMAILETFKDSLYSDLKEYADDYLEYAIMFGVKEIIFAMDSRFYFDKEQIDNFLNFEVAFDPEISRILLNSKNASLSHIKIIYDRSSDELRDEALMAYFAKYSEGGSDISAYRDFYNAMVDNLLNEGAEERTFLLEFALEHLEKAGGAFTEGSKSVIARVLEVSDDYSLRRVAVNEYLESDYDVNDDVMNDVMDFCLEYSEKDFLIKLVENSDLSEEYLAKVVEARYDGVTMKVLSHDNCDEEVRYMAFNLGGADVKRAAGEMILANDDFQENMDHVVEYAFEEKYYEMLKDVDALGFEDSLENVIESGVISDERFAEFFDAVSDQPSYEDAIYVVGKYLIKTTRDSELLARIADYAIDNAQYGFQKSIRLNKAVTFAILEKLYMEGADVYKEEVLMAMRAHPEYQENNIAYSENGNGEENGDGEVKNNDSDDLVFGNTG